MGFRLDTSAARRDLRGISRRVEAAARNTGRTLAQGVFADTQREVPKDTGALAASGRMDENTGGSVFTWNIQYGNSNVDRIGVYYAAAVHERAARHAAPTKMKFVEDPMVRSTPLWQRSIARAVRRAI